jgi:hypothetical protein
MSDYRQLFEERKNKAIAEAEGYIGVYANGTIVERKKLEDLLFFPSFTFIFHKFAHEYKESTSATPYTYLTFELIDEKGVRIPLKINNVPVFDLKYGAGYSQESKAQNEIWGYPISFQALLFDTNGEPKHFYLDKINFFEKNNEISYFPTYTFFEAYQNLYKICKIADQHKTWYEFNKFWPADFLKLK